MIKQATRLKYNHKGDTGMRKTIALTVINYYNYQQCAECYENAHFGKPYILDVHENAVSSKCDVRSLY